MAQWLRRRGWPQDVVIGPATEADYEALRPSAHDLLTLPRLPDRDEDGPEPWEAQ